MKYINQNLYDHPRAYLSLESRVWPVVLGFMCLKPKSTRDSGETKYQRVCEDGPVFKNRNSSFYEGECRDYKSITSFSTYELKNPITPASGCFGFGQEYAKYYDLDP